MIPRITWAWRETGWVQEGHKSPLYCCAFNHFNRQGGDLLATAGSCRATVYRCLPNGKLQTVHVFQDSDPSEDYYTCAWSLDTATGAPLLLVAGKNRLLQVINCVTGFLETTFEGHGHCINDIAVHPTRPNLVATASRDSALRLWNLRSRVCVLVFHGDGSHRNEVLSLDWQAGGGLTLVSGGMDNCVKVWSLSAFASTLDASDTWDSASQGQTVAFPTRVVTVPEFSTTAVHWNYVDCVRWLGSFLLSKSVDNRIVCWQPDPEAGPGAGTVEGGTVGLGLRAGEDAPGALRGSDGAVKYICELQLEDCRHVWWVRFGLDYWRQVVAAGTATGQVLVFAPHSGQGTARARLRPRRAAGRPPAGLLVRQTAVSQDGNIIVACHEDGSVTRFDAVEGSGESREEEEEEEEEDDGVVVLEEIAGGRRKVVARGKG